MPNGDGDEQRRDGMELVRRFLEVPFDSKVRGELWAEDGVFEAPYSTRGRTVVHGRERILRRMLLLADVMSDPVFTDVQVFSTQDPELFFTLSTFEATICANGKRYRDEYVQIFEVRDGRIRRRVEYFNPLTMQLAMDGKPLSLTGDDKEEAFESGEDAA